MYILAYHHVLPANFYAFEVRQYKEITGRFPVRGNLVPDAHLAAILHQHGVQKIYTGDRDFLKFDFLDVRDPFI